MTEALVDKALSLARHVTGTIRAHVAATGRELLAGLAPLAALCAEDARDVAAVTRRVEAFKGAEQRLAQLCAGAARLRALGEVLEARMVLHEVEDARVLTQVEVTPPPLVLSGHAASLTPY